MCPAPAGVMELVDVVDSKSTAGDSVPVRVRSPAPARRKLCIACDEFFVCKKLIARSRRCSSFSSRKRFAGLRLDGMRALEWCVFFANTRRIAASFVSLATSFLFPKKLIVRSRRCSSLPNRTRLRWASILGKRALLKSASFLSTYTAITRSEPVPMGDRFGFLRSLRNGTYPF